MGRPSMVVDATALMSWSSLGSTDAGPAPRQTFTVGTSWRILLQAQRNSGKLRNEPFWNVMVRSGAGGKPLIQPSVCGSVSAADAGCWLATVVTDIKAGSKIAEPLYHRMARRTSQDNATQERPARAMIALNHSHS